MGCDLVNVEDKTTSHHASQIYTMENFNVIPYGGESGELKFVQSRSPFYGTDEKDILIGSSRRNLLHGEKGNDIIKAGAGNDWLGGGGGDDTLHGGSGIDTLLGGKGNDTLIGGEDADRFFLGVGNDVIADYNSNEGDFIGLAFLTNWRFEQIGADVKVFSDQGVTKIQNTELEAIHSDAEFIRYTSRPSGATEPL